VKTPDGSHLEILIVDDEAPVRHLLSDLLGGEYECIGAESGEEALELLVSRRPGVVISDINMSGMDGLELLAHAHRLLPESVVIMVTGNRTLENAVEAIREGAFDFITKPFDLEHVEFAVRRAVEHHKLLAAKRRYDDTLEELVHTRTQQLEYLAYHDELTGLPNRTLLEDKLARALVEAQGSGLVATMIVSPERFRDLRDAFGHSSGDWLLKEFSSRLCGALPPEVTVARFDGDEFAVIVPQVGGESDIADIAVRVSDALATPFSTGSRRIFLDASIGVSIYPQDGSDSHTLIRNAGAALSQARRAGSRVEFFDRAIRDASVRRLTLENDLRHALQNGDLDVHYQPKISIRTGAIVGAEALMQWRHSSGDICPTEFIPIAEDTGLIVELGQWILNEACSAARTWHDAGYHLTVAVNVSPIQFDSDIVAVVREALDSSGLRPDLLELEVTESSVMRNAEHAASLLRDLRLAGLRVSIDDFGTGYSSLGHLKHLPIDVLKIDRSFIADVTTNSQDASLVMGIVGLAHSLNLRTVAEGVETEAQLRFLNLIKCDEWQGFLASKAVTRAEFEQLVSLGREFRV
jgi:diguanylate cyclase (GGDEF)-like protein